MSFPKCAGQKPEFRFEDLPCSKSAGEISVIFV